MDTELKLTTAERDEAERMLADYVSKGLDPKYARMMIMQTIARNRGPETHQARPTETAPESQPRQLHQEKASEQKLTTGKDNSQPKSLVKVTQWGTELTDTCAYVTINSALTNCRTINWTEKALLAIVNFNTGTYGYASISFEQLAHWLGVKPGTVKNMVNKLEKQQFMQDLGKYPNSKHRLVICSKWRNPERRKRVKAADNGA